MTAFEIVGQSYAVPLGVTPSKGAAQLLAAHLGLEPTNHAVSGAVLYYSKLAGGYATVANALSRASSTYQRGAEYGVVWYGGNDLYAMDSTFSTASQAHLKSAFRFAISRMCAGKVFDDEDASLAYSGFERVPNALGESKVTGLYDHYAVANGSKVTINVPSNFPGGTVAAYLGALNTAGATWTFKVDGVAQEETLSTAFNYPVVGEVMSMFCRRFTGLAPGAHTIECVASSIVTYALFDSWAIEAPTPPTVIVPGQYTLQEYTGGETHTPVDADIVALEKLQKEVCAEFGSYVKFVDLSSMNKTTHVQADKVHPTEAGHQEIYELMVAALKEGGEEVVGAHMDLGFVRDSERRLVVTAGGTGKMERGFLCDASRRLVVNLGGTGKMEGGLVRDSGRRLCVAEGQVSHVSQGLPRDTAGRLVIAKTGGVKFSQGFLRDSQGRVVVSGLS